MLRDLKITLPVGFDCSVCLKPISLFSNETITSSTGLKVNEFVTLTDKSTCEKAANENSIRAKNMTYFSIKMFYKLNNLLEKLTKQTKEVPLILYYKKL